MTADSPYKDAAKDRLRRLSGMSHTDLVRLCFSLELERETPLTKAAGEMLAMLGEVKDAFDDALAVSEPDDPADSLARAMLADIDALIARAKGEQQEVQGE